MRKQFKKALSMVLSAAMVLTLGSGLELKSVKAAEKTCPVTFNDSESKEVLDLGTIKGDGTYTLKYEGEFYANEKNTALYLQFGDDKGVGMEDAKAPAVKDVTVKADGKEVKFTKAPAITKDGKKVQIQFYNAWGGQPWDGTNPATVLADGKTALDCEKSLEFTFTLEGFWDAPDPVETEAPATSGDATETPDPDKTADPGTGGATNPGATDAPDPADESFETGIVMTAQDYGISGAGPEDVDAAEQAGVKLYDTKVSGKGQYQVATDLRAALGAQGIQFTALYIIGAEKYFPNYVIRLDHMKINGEDVPEETLKKAYTCSDEGVTTRINLYNGWCNEDDASKEPPRPDARSMEDLKNCTPYMLEDYADDEIMTMEIAFTYGPKDYVSEQDKASIAESLIPEKPELEDPDPVQTPGPDQPGQPTPNPNQPTQNPGGTQPTKAPAAPTQAPAAGLTNGTTAKVGGATYKVTDAKAGAVEFSAPKKNATSVTIPATVKVNGKSCKVTSIKAKAFSGNKKLKSVVIGKNIKTIGKQAFFKCTKLKKVTFKGTAVKKIGAKAFAKTNKKMTVTVPKKLKKKALNNYKKLLKKAGVSKKAKYKKK